MASIDRNSRIEQQKRKPFAIVIVNDSGDMEVLDTTENHEDAMKRATYLLQSTERRGGRSRMYEVWELKAVVRVKEPEPAEVPVEVIQIRD